VRSLRLGSKDYLAEVYAATSSQELQAAYQNWAASYDQDLKQKGWDKPELVVDLVGALCPPGAKVVEFGVGTGLVGRCLRRAGFETITGLDFSSAMLQQASLTGAYQRLILADLKEPLELESHSFDLALAVGIFTEGHLDATSLPEMVRVVRPGGHFAFSLRDDLEEALGFRQACHLLERTRRWRSCQRRIFTQGLGGHPWSAWIFEIT